MGCFAQIRSDELLVVVFTRRRGGKTEAITRRKLRDDIAEHACGHVMALVDEDHAEARGDNRYVAHPRECLHHGDRNRRRDLLLRRINLSDLAFRYPESVFYLFQPLIVDLPPMRQNERGLFLLCYQGESHDRLTSASWSYQDALVIVRTCRNCGFLVWK